MLATNTFWAVTMCALGAGPAVEHEAAALASVVISVIEQAEVPARELGPLISIQVEEGDTVKKGALLARIDDGDPKLASKRAELELESARADAENAVRVQLAQKTLELAKSELARGERTRDLFENAITDEEIERRRLKVDRAELEVRQSEHEARQAQIHARLSDNALQLANRQVERCRIIAPLSGVVVQINRRAGEWVQPGDAVLRIVRLDRLRAEGFLKASQLTLVKPGQAVSLRTKLGNGQEKTFPGVLTFISPEIIAADNRVRVWAEVQNKDLMLRPGMRASLLIDADAEE